MLKKILYICPAFPVGGAEKFLIMLANSMVKDTSGQTVVSLSTNNKLQNEFDPFIRFLPIPRKSKFDLSSVRALTVLIKKDRPDVIFCLNFFSYFFTRVALFGSGIKTPVYISYQTTIHVNKKEHLLHRLWISMLSKRDTILFTSKNQEIYTVRQYKIPARLYRTIINGINLTRWHLPENPSEGLAVRTKYEIPPEAQVIILTAAFRVEKNHSGAIRALKILHENYSKKAYLLFVGTGQLREESAQIARDLQMQDFVKFTGPQDDVRPFYWASNLFTLCSTAVETFSFAALEAMACGLPAVLTEIGGASEMIKDGFNGFLCQPEDSDIALKWNQALSTKFSNQTIHEFADKNFNVNRMTTEYKEILLAGNR